MNELRDLFDDVETRLRHAIETLRGINIHRVSNPREAATKIGRALDYLEEVDLLLYRASMNGVRPR